MTVLTKGLTDASMVAWRNLLNVRRTQDWIFAAVLQPIMFVALFGFLFGGLLGGPAYREFLLAGILAQTLAFNSAFTVVGLASDLNSGMIDRFRSLPISPSAVLIGRTSSDLAVSVVALVVMTLCGAAIGWRVRGSLLDVLFAYLLLLLFALAMSWIGALVGLLSPNPEVAQSAGLIWLSPLTFVSSAFVPERSMPPLLRILAEWNPVTAVINASRDLFGNANPVGVERMTGWPAENAALYSVLCSGVIIAVFVPLSLRAFRRAAAR
ncbi:MULTISPECIES: ABC transporter permease [unclassified Micromonospora]|uniref:ABC transporter permease n=1 Tax=unclassified Micromonospora TaxID=2617518 RepID=UPI0022B68E1F|nr:MULTISPECIES: ABC transporter permease [unclassified Micromonospora]MCZ7421950.1 ABC transporter permease [Verrucosispora sp. WMMA2121]WBB93315.1 ABC transporter permease [Verrucosispora sp. WMMC514]